MGLPGIWHGFMNQPPRSEQNRVTPTLSRELEKLLQKIGIQRMHEQGKIGPYELEPRAFDAGPTWDDYLASNPALPGDQVVVDGGPGAVRWSAAGARRLHQQPRDADCSGAADVRKLVARARHGRRRTGQRPRTIVVRGVMPAVRAVLPRSLRGGCAGEVEGGADAVLDERAGQAAGDRVGGLPAGAVGGDDQVGDEPLEGPDGVVDDRLEQRAGQVEPADDRVRPDSADCGTASLWARVISTAR